MITIYFKKGDIFEYGMQVSDVIAYFGYKGKEFEIPFKKLKEEYSELKDFYNPFEQRPSDLIKFGNKYLFCVPGDFLNNDGCSIVVKALLNAANNCNAKNVVMNRIRDIESYDFGNKQSKIDADNRRVKFIVDQINEWYEENKETTSIKNVTLIASSDIFTRNQR